MFADESIPAQLMLRVWHTLPISQVTSGAPMISMRNDSRAGKRPARESAGAPSAAGGAVEREARRHRIAAVVPGAVEPEVGAAAGGQRAVVAGVAGGDGRSVLGDA